MKNIYKLAFVALSAAFLTGCEEDTVTYNGTDFVTLQNTSATTLSVTEAAGIVSIPIDITYAQSSDLTISYTLTSDTAVEGVHYNVISSSITLPAGETETEFKIQIIDDTDFNVSRELEFTLTGTSSPSVNAGLTADEGSFHKTITIGNDDYDCPTQFNFWLGNLDVDTDGEDSSATGAGGAGCDVLYVTGNLAQFDANNDVYDIEFTADDDSGETGTVTVSSMVQAGYELSDGTVVDVVYDGEGIYDVTTGEITIDYSLNAYQGTSVLGYFAEGTTTIRLAE